MRLNNFHPVLFQSVFFVFNILELNLLFMIDSFAATKPFIKNDKVCIRINDNKFESDVGCGCRKNDSCYNPPSAEEMIAPILGPLRESGMGDQDIKNFGNAINIANNLILGNEVPQESINSKENQNLSEKLAKQIDVLKSKVMKSGDQESLTKLMVNHAENTKQKILEKLNLPANYQFSDEDVGTIQEPLEKFIGKSPEQKLKRPIYKMTDKKIISSLKTNSVTPTNSLEPESDSIKSTIAKDEIAVPHKKVSYQIKSTIHQQTDDIWKLIEHAYTKKFFDQYTEIAK